MPAPKSMALWAGSLLVAFVLGMATTGLMPADKGAPADQAPALWQRAARKDADADADTELAARHRGAGAEAGAAGRPPLSDAEQRGGPRPPAARTDVAAAADVEVHPGCAGTGATGWFDHSTKWVRVKGPKAEHRQLLCVCGPGMRCVGPSCVAPGWAETEPRAASALHTSATESLITVNPAAAFPARCTQCHCANTPNTPAAVGAAAVPGGGGGPGSVGGAGSVDVDAGRDEMVHVAMLVIGPNKFKSQG